MVIGHIPWHPPHPHPETSYAVPSLAFSTLATFTPGFMVFPAIAAAIESAVSWLAVARMQS